MTKQTRRRYLIHLLPIGLRLAERCVSAFHVQSLTTIKPIDISGSRRFRSASSLASSESEESAHVHTSGDENEIMKCIEVEQKFSTTNLEQVQSKLIQMGFESTKTSVNFMDWYFDVPDQDLTLCTQDFWLRYRHPSDNPSVGILGWQLKMGKRIKNTTSTSTSTVYEEMEGENALDIVKSLLIDAGTSSSASAADSDTLETMDSFSVPQPPGLEMYCLQPFARIETIRSSWNSKSNDDKYKDIVVDLDGTDYGYTVGEVEVVVSSDEQVEAARTRVQDVIQEITGDGASIALGKLETYLINNRPEVYNACIKSGSMKS